VSGICDEANISRPTFYAYFRHKKAMMLELCSRVLHSRLATVTSTSFEATDDFTKIVLANDAYMTVWANETAVLFEYTQLSNSDPDFARLRTEDLGPGEQRIENKLMRLMMRGAIPQRDPRALTLMLSSMAEGFCFRYFAKDKPLRQIRDEFPGILQLLTDAWYAIVYCTDPPAGYPFEQHRLEIVEGSDQRVRSVMTGSPVRPLTTRV
jgi:AcrR family transcriptional regulator